MSTGSYRYFMRGRAAGAPVGAHLAGSSSSGRKVKLQEWDVYLKKFQCVPVLLFRCFEHSWPPCRCLMTTTRACARYGNALDAVLAGGTPLMTVSVVEELDRRDGLQAALRGRNSATLEPFLRFVVAHVANPRYSSVLISTANIILDMYASVVGHSSVIDALLRKLGEKVKTELELQQRLLKLQGLMEMLLAGSTCKAQASPAEAAAQTSDNGAGGNVA